MIAAPTTTRPDTHTPGGLFDELVIDSFAGGGGASLGIEWGLGRAVNIEGQPHVITDLGMRMLTPRELYRCQGFPDSYEIAPIDPATGKRLTKSAQVRMCGNSVCPQVAAALVRANLVEIVQPASQEVA